MSTTIDYLIETVRLRIGDINSESYRYADEWIVKALTLAVKLSARYWNNKYLTTDEGVVSRNPYGLFLLDEATYGTIEDRDEPVLVLMAAIVILQGNLENSAWDISSWKDAEISFSNLESGRIKNDNLKMMKAELDDLITPPRKKLARTKKGSLPGYSTTDSAGFEKTGL